MSITLQSTVQNDIIHNAFVFIRGLWKQVSLANFFDPVEAYFICSVINIIVLVMGGSLSQGQTGTSQR